MTIKPPTPTQLKNANMGLVPNLPAIVVENGKVVRVWNGTNFVKAPANTPYTTQLYAVDGSWIAKSTEEPHLYLGGSALGGSDL